MIDVRDDPILRLILAIRARVIAQLARLPEDLRNLDADLALIEEAWAGELARRKTREMTWDDIFG